MTREPARLLLTLAMVFGLANPAFADTTRVLMMTSLGDIELELDGDKAPKSVANFLRYVDEGFYDGTIFHRVINNFMIQGGGFTPDMARKENHSPIKNEAKNGLKNSRGSIAMARTSAPHSGTSQFFINHVDNKNLDYPSFDGWGYAVFGRVSKGMETVDRIAEVHTKDHRGMQNVPREPVVIEKVTRITESK
jgi:cyclophilin family peptidyl-prolyl cis-trans isomerase